MSRSLLGLPVAEPNCFLQGHDGPAYDVKFYGDGEESLLLRFVFVILILYEFEWSSCSIQVQLGKPNPGLSMILIQLVYYPS